MIHPYFKAFFLGLISFILILLIVVTIGFAIFLMVTIYAVLITCIATLGFIPSLGWSWLLFKTINPVYHFLTNWVDSNEFISQLDHNLGN